MKRNIGKHAAARGPRTNTRKNERQLGGACAMAFTRVGRESRARESSNCPENQILNGLILRSLSLSRVHAHDFTMDIAPMNRIHAASAAAVALAGIAAFGVAYAQPPAGHGRL
jgi:hypothetical protein